MPKDSAVEKPAQLRTETPFGSFFRRYFNTKMGITFGIALLLSLPIYLQLLPITPGWVPLAEVWNNWHRVNWLQLGREIVSLLSLSIGLFLIFRVRFYPFWLGFFLGVLWFHWISFSFYYYQMGYLIPLVIVALGIGYGLLFWAAGGVIGFIEKKIPEGYRDGVRGVLWGLFLFLLPFFKPFTFNWFQLQPLLATTPLPPTSIGFGVLLIALFLLACRRVLHKELGAALLLLSLLLPVHSPQLLPLIEVGAVSTDIPQDQKWNQRVIPTEIAEELMAIQTLVKGGYQLVITPEVSFPLVLNNYPPLIEELALLSKGGAILVGSLYHGKRGLYNVGYLFQHGKLEQIIKKHILVPFGEYIPLPFFHDLINKIFHNGAEDLERAPTFGHFKILFRPPSYSPNLPPRVVEFLLGICYELTSEELYTQSPIYIVGLSNNGWFFLPGIPISIEPILQRLLIEYYSYNYKKVVFHTTNRSGSYIINVGRYQPLDGISLKWGGK
jgi:apolipoprotein N-acyltransferase